MAKTARDYPISFPFGATSSPYSASKPHHGADYGTPKGTPLVVSGVQLGLTGDTGYTFGAHLHVDKNPNYPASSGYVNPIGWWDIRGTVVFTGAAGTAGNMVVVKSDNRFYRFLHLSRIDVKVGQVIKEGQMKTNRGEAIRLYRTTVRVNNPTEAQIKSWTNRDLDTLLAAIEKDARYKAITKKLESSGVDEQAVKDGLFNKIKQIFNK